MSKIHFTARRIASDYYLSSQVEPPLNQIIGGLQEGDDLFLRSNPTNVKGQVIIDETTPSNSTTTGALIVKGGVGIQGTLTAATLNAINITGPHSSLTALTVGDDHTQYAFLDGRSGGQILTGGTAVSNNLVLRSTTNAAKGQVYIDETTSSTSTITGALRVAGGVGIAGALYANSGNFVTLTAPHSGLSGLLNDNHTQYTLNNGRINGQIITGGTLFGDNLVLRSTSDSVKGQIILDEETDSTSISSGALVVLGGVGIFKQLSLGDSIGFYDIPQPSNPLIGHKVFFDNSTSLLSSVDSNGVLTTYQPTTTKGDILTHDGTTQTRLPVGSEGQILYSINGELQWKHHSDDVYNVTSDQKSTESSYNVVTSFIYRGSNVAGAWDNFSFSSYKNTSDVFTYSIRVWDTGNHQVIAEVTGLNNTVPVITTTTNLSNIPTTEALIEIQCKLSTDNEFGVLHSSFKFGYI